MLGEQSRVSNKNNKKNTGSTLIEVLVAILIVGLVITAAMLSVTYSIKNSAEARYREVASQLAQDGMEVVVLRREIEQWSQFSGFNNATYCLPQNSPKFGSSPTNPSTDCGFIVQNKTFYRYLTKSYDSGTGVVTAKVTVEWKSDSNTTQNVEISQQFRDRAI